MNKPHVTYILTISYALEQEHQVIIIPPSNHQQFDLLEHIERLNEEQRVYSLVRVAEHFYPKEPSGEWRTEVTVEEVRATILTQKQLILDPVQNQETTE